jgi:flagellar L-ring protein precursor FlgH
MTRLRASACVLAVLVSAWSEAHAADLAPAGNWSSLASDRIARSVGDVLTVIVYENSTGTGSAESTVNKTSSFQGQVSAGNPSGNSLAVNETASLGLGHNADNAGTTTRAGTMVGEISVVIDALLPNGDLHVAGAQVLNINGERTRIAVKGRVRTADISSANTVLSTSLADATIDYDGAGIVTDSSRAGILTRALNWLGIP